jgi:hypothetical protein
MIQLDSPPDTSVYMIAGYSIFFALMIIYLVSLILRSRNLNQDLNTLEGMKDESRGMEGQMQAGGSEPVKSRGTKPQPAGRKKSKPNVSK